MPLNRVWIAIPLISAVGLAVVLQSRARPPAAIDIAGVTDPHRSLGATTELRPDYQDRVYEMEAALTTAPDSVALLLEVGRLHRDAHDPGRAIELFTRATRIEPSRRVAWLNLADAHARQGEWSEVVTVMTDMLAHHPGDGTALYNLGAAHANLGALSSARDAWARASASDDRDVAMRARDALDRIGKGA